ncbi:hypothetical protein ACTXT7_007363 [Hymenolepis weldensis]
MSAKLEGDSQYILQNYSPITFYMKIFWFFVREAAMINPIASNEYWSPNTSPMLEVTCSTSIHTPTERNGQPHWLSLTNTKGGRIRVIHQGGFMISLSIRDKLLKTLPK